MNINRLIAVIPALVLILSAAAARAESWGPWSVDGKDIVLADRSSQKEREHPSTDTSIVSMPFIWLLKFYQGVISPVDGGRCPMYPTCSQYSVQAIRKHGPLVGIIMTSDRLMHELDEQRFSRVIKVGNRYRFSDTVENNDFWWDNR